MDGKKVSDAQMRAVKKYQLAHYKKLSANVKIADYDYIDSFCKKEGISKANLIVNSCKYVIDSGIYKKWIK